jgi:hypothetical protein
VGLVIGALWIHLWAMVVGAKNGLEQTMKSVFYGATPMYLLGWIPFVGILASLWGLVLVGIGLMRLQNLSSGRAILAILIAIVIPVVIAFSILAVFLGTLLMGLGGMGGFDPSMLSQYY